MPIDFLAIGHVTRDLIPGGWRLGGAVTYAAALAQRLGRRPGIVTSARQDLDFSDLAGLPIHLIPADQTTCFENHYDDRGRHQRVDSRAATLEAFSVPTTWWDAPIRLIAPVCGEIGERFTLDRVTPITRAPRLATHDSRLTPITGLALQGWLRAWDSAGWIGFRFWRDPGGLLGQADFVFASREDFSADPAALSNYQEHARCLVLTDGPMGCRIYMAGRERQVPGYPAEVVDLTGAGDVFAAAFLIRWQESHDLEEAAGFANAAAALSIEGIGLTALPDQAQIAERRQETS